MNYTDRISVITPPIICILSVFTRDILILLRVLLPFHANLLQAAISADAPVQPVGLRFRDKASGVTSHAPSYIGDDTLIGSIWRTLSAPPMVAVVHYGTPEKADNRDRRAWSQHLHATVDGLRKS